MQIVGKYQFQCHFVAAAGQTESYAGFDIHEFRGVVHNSVYLL